jgi:hypothetical protein
MARKRRDEIIETGGLFGWQRWCVLIRTDEFWEDLYQRAQAGSESDPFIGDA